MNIPDRGIGITYFLSLEEFIKSNIDIIDVIEIEPQNFWFHTSSNKFRIDDTIFKRIKALPCKKIIHSVSMPVGGSVSPDHQQIVLLNKIINDLNAAWISEHLAFNKANSASGIFNTGFLLPPCQTNKGVEYAVRTIKALTDEFPVPLAIETGVNYLKPNNGSELRDGEFIAKIVEKSGCGILLDLHNIWTNEINGRQKVKDFIEDIPLEMVWEVHLAGGVEEDGYWLDAHAGAIPHDLLKIAESIIPRLKNLHAIIFELYPSYLSEISPELIREQLKVLHNLWDISRNKFGSNAIDIHVGEYDNYYNHDVIITTKPSSSIHSLINHGNHDNDSDPYMPEEWEYTLGKLVTSSTKVNTSLGRILSADPAIALYKRLIASFRASMLVRALPLTSRLLMLSSDFNKLLSHFWENNSPELFTTDEALSFIRYIEEGGLYQDIPYLKDIITLERAILISRIEGRKEEVLFNYDPTVLLNALVQRRLPETPISCNGIFKIEATSDDISCIKISNTGLIKNNHYDHIDIKQYKEIRSWNH
jgi:uncharacterized protein